MIPVWIAANLLGVAAVFGLGFAFPFLKFIPGILVSSLLIGVPIGFAQWMALRRHFAGSLLWMPGSAAGLGLGAGIVLATNLVDQSGLASIILVTVVYAIATGYVISRLRTELRRLPALRSG